MRFTSRRKAATIAAAAGAAALAVGAVALAQSGDGGGEQQTPHREQVTQVPPEMAASMSIFRRNRAAGDELPSELAATLGKAVEVTGANPELSRRAGAGWAVPGNGFVCLAQQTGGGCGALPRLARTGVTFGVRFHHASGFEIAGVAQDRVESVTATLPDGQAKTARVQANSFSLRVNEAPVTLTVTSDDGSTVDVQLSIPTDAPLAPPEGLPEDRVP